MVIMIRNGKRKKITKKQFRNYFLNLQARKAVEKEIIKKEDKAE